MIIVFTVSVILRTNPIITEKFAEKSKFKRKALKESSNSTTLHLTIGRSENWKNEIVCLMKGLSRMFLATVLHMT